MTLYEFLSLAISLLATVISIIGFFRARKAQRSVTELAKLQLEEHRSERDKANVQASFEPSSGKSWYLVLSCTSKVAAENVQLEWESPEPVFIGESHDRLPVKKLHPDIPVKLPVVKFMGSLASFKPIVRWTNPDGTESREEFDISMSR